MILVNNCKSSLLFFFEQLFIFRRESRVLPSRALPSRVPSCRALSQHRQVYISRKSHFKLGFHDSLDSPIVTSSVSGLIDQQQDPLSA